MRKLSFIFAFVAAMFVPLHGFAQLEIPAKPSEQTSVYDYANMLEDQDEAALKEKLLKYADSTSNQMVVVTIESLKGEDIGILTPKWAQEWGIGQSDTDNGVLILVAKEERKIWISPGYGLEDKITAGIGGEITRNIIVPEFKEGNIYAGLNKGTDALIDVIAGKYKDASKARGRGGDEGFPWPALLVVFFVVVFIIIGAIRRGGRGGRGGLGGGGGMGLGEIILLSSLGRSGGGGFGGGGGGFGGGFGGGGFGGGGFSGGGSGGSW